MFPHKRILVGNLHYVGHRRCQGRLRMPRNEHRHSLLCSARLLVTTVGVVVVPAVFGEQRT
eukprot:scaffold7161_cov133-Cylindrotheca_fusiformis.AAC.2